MKTTIEINEANFEGEVLQSNQPVLVVFWAEWCGPCKMLAPLLDEIATEQAGRVKVAKVNVDANPALAARFGIQSIPTLLYFAGGEVRDKTVGVTGKRAIVSKLEKLAVPLEPKTASENEKRISRTSDKRIVRTFERQRFHCYRITESNVAQTMTNCSTAIPEPSPAPSRRSGRRW